MRSMHEALMHTVEAWLFQWNILVQLVIWAELITYFMEHHFYLQEWQGKYIYSDLIIWQVFSQKFIEKKPAYLVISTIPIDSVCCQC